MKHRISAGVIVEHEGRILMVHSVMPGRYDFWVAPGGGVQGLESLAEAACREAWEETGLTVTADRVGYIEELADETTRYCKFWHLGQWVGGTRSIDHPEAQAEGIVEAAWLSRTELEARTVYPTFLRDRYWADRQAGFPGVTHIALRRMETC